MRAHPGARLLRHPSGRLGVALLAAVALPALLAPWLPLEDPHATHLAQRFLPAPSPGHPLGSDHLGRDLLARLVWGSRSSLAVGAGATLIAAGAGTFIGLVAGHFGRWWDLTLMRLVEVLLAFPYLLLALAIVAALGPGLEQAALAIAIVNIPFFARSVRGETRRLREREFVAAARLGGAGELAILYRELLPNVLPVVLVMTGTTVGWMILETAGLSFLGLGAQPPAADLGSMLGEGRRFLVTRPGVVMLPGLVIFLLVIGLNLLGDALRDLLDPRLAAPPDGDGGAGDPPAPSPPTPLTPSAPLLAVEALTTTLPGAGEGVGVVREVAFTLGEGERLGMVGESGSGKSLTVSSLLGLLPPGARCRGSVRFQGRELVGLTEEAWGELRGNRIGLIPQDPFSALDPLFPVGSQVAEALRVHQPHLPRREVGRRVLELLERVRLPDPPALWHAHPHQLSGGMRQRVVIAMALANDPRLLIADEPTTALDVTVQAGILELMDRACRERGTALLLVSHDLGVIARMCDRVVVMYAGAVVEEAPVEMLLGEPRHPYTRALLACTPELGRPDKALHPIPGEPPRPGALERGCRFAPRCPRVRPACGEAEPPLLPSGERRLRCPVVQGEGP